jgi:phosphopantothenoylcysteine synthetase/decarboxylase
MAKTKPLDNRVEIELPSLMTLVKTGSCSVRIDGNKATLKLDPGDLDKEDQSQQWENIANDAQAKADELLPDDEDLDELEDDDDEEFEEDEDDDLEGE